MCLCKTNINLILDAFIDAFTLVQFRSECVSKPPHEVKSVSKAFQRDLYLVFSRSDDEVTMSAISSTFPTLQAKSSTSHRGLKRFHPALLPLSFT